MQQQNDDINRELEPGYGLLEELTDQAQAQYVDTERERTVYRSRGKDNESDSREQSLEYELSSSRLPIVRYLPAPPSVDFFNQTPTSEWLAKWVPSDLPSVCIARHNASCHICLMDFEEPLLQLSVETQAEPVDLETMEPLRQLPCRHVFHQLCIDAYLQGDESNRYRCPVCHKKVITLTSYLDQWQADFRLLMAVETDGLELVDLELENSELEGLEQEELSQQDLQPEQNSGRDIREEVTSDNKENRFTDGSLEFDSDGIAVLSPYTFEPNNKHLTPSSSIRPSLSDAKKLLKNNGTLSEAALLIEAVIQVEDLGKDEHEAWVLLGDTRRLDMRHEEGMQALAVGARRALAAGSTTGLLSLAISYLNGYHHKACTIVLLRWLQIRAPTFPLPEGVSQFLIDPSRDTPDDIINVFIGIIRTKYSEGLMDLDMLTSLGILFHAKKDHFNEKACYVAILALHENYLSWNMLGVALRHCDMLEEALEAYNVALQFRPSYTRAWANLGAISYSMGAYKESAQYYLGALALQESAGGKATTLLWGHLHDSLLRLGRDDLAKISTLDHQTSLDVYRSEGFEFLDMTNHSGTI